MQFRRPRPFLAFSIAALTGLRIRHIRAKPCQASTANPGTQFMRVSDNGVEPARTRPNRDQLVESDEATI